MQQKKSHASDLLDGLIIKIVEKWIASSI